MAEKQWGINIANKQYRIVVKWSRWTNAGELKVGGNVVKVWSPGIFVPEEVQFDIEGKRAILRRTSFPLQSWDLYVDGKHIRP